MHAGHWLFAAVACAVLPLGVAVAIFAAWYLTQAGWLAAAGLVDIGAGLALLPAGLFCVYRYSRLVDRASVPRWFRNAMATLVLLLGNVPAAVGFVYAAAYVSSAYRVVVENDSAAPVRDLVLRSPMGQYRVGEVAPDTSVERIFRFAGEGEVTYSAVIGERRIDGVLDGYVSSGIGGTTILTFTASGRAEVRNAGCSAYADCQARDLRRTP